MKKRIEKISYLDNLESTEWTSTDPNENGLTLDLNAMIETAYKSIIAERPKTLLFGIPVVLNSYVPEGEIWCVNNKEEIFKIINIGNSKLYRFILWFQHIIQSIKNKIRGEE
jgi:hypothetical protein